MEQVIGNLYVGGDDDYQRLRDRAGWSFLRCCKHGPGGHQQTLGYKTLAAPKGPDYLHTTRGNVMSLNFIDANDPHFIPKEMVDKGLHFIDQRLKVGDKVLVACNTGISRGPTTAMLYLRATGELPSNFIASERVFRTLYRSYDPGLGVRQFARSHWPQFENALRK